MSDYIWTPPTGNRSHGRIHRATCRHLPKTAKPVPVTTGADGPDSGEVKIATLATCCSPRADEVATLWAAIRDAERKRDKELDALAEAERTGDKVIKLTGRGSVSDPRPECTCAADALASSLHDHPCPLATDKMCTGECGEVRPLRSFPTKKGGGRGTECRRCRDARYAANRTARA